MVSAVQHIQGFAEEVMDSARRLGTVIQQIEGGVQTVTDSDGHQRRVELPSTAEQARTKVRQYFAELLEMLKRQEVAALTVVDTHIRERLCMHRQQQEDMAILLSQTSAVCHHCEKTLQQVESKTLHNRNFQHFCYLGFFWESSYNVFNICSPLSQVDCCLLTVAVLW